MIGAILGARYEITGLLADGPLFETYSARDRQMGRDVGIRVLKPPFSRDQLLINRLADTVAKYRSIQSPNIETLVAVDQDDQQAFIVGELTRGPSLSDRIRKLAPFSIQVAVGTGMSICAALEGLHKAKVAHGDLNPNNIAVLADGDVRLQLTGIWEAYSASVTAAGLILPSMAPYLAPDVSGGAMPSPRSDVYSIGVILYELLTGRLPYYADTSSAMALQHATSPTPGVRTANPSVPNVLEEIIRKAMSKEPALRYASAGDLLADLRILQDGLRFGRHLTWPLRSGSPATAAATKAPSRTAPAPRTPTPSRSTNPTATTPSPSATGRPATPKVKASPQPQRVAPRMSAIRSDEEYEDQPRRESRERDVPIWMIVIVTFLGAVAVSLVAFFLLDNLHKPRLVPIPDLKALSLAEARAVLKESKLQLRVNGREPNDRIDVDHILKVDESVNAKVPEGYTVGVVVSSGSRSVAVPDLRGMTLDKARAVLRSLNLDLDDATDRAPDPEIGQGLIVRSNPPAKAQVDRRSRIHVSVSSGANGASVANDAGSPVETSPNGTPLNPDPVIPPGKTATTFTLHLRHNDLPHSTRVKIEITDANGTRAIADQMRDPGDAYDVRAVGVGDQATFLIYYDGRLVKRVSRPATTSTTP